MAVSQRRETARMLAEAVVQYGTKVSLLDRLKSAQWYQLWGFNRGQHSSEKLTRISYEEVSKYVDLLTNLEGEGPVAPSHGSTMASAVA